MDFFEKYVEETKVDTLKELVEKEYARYGANITLICSKVLADRMIFQVRLKKGTRTKQVFDKTVDVQFRIRMPLFVLGKCGFMIYLVMSDKKIEYPHLPLMLMREDLSSKCKNMKLPYVVGHNIFGELLFVDLAEQPHALFGGSTNSGKTVGIKALISSIAFWKSPEEVNLILIDTGANDLVEFGTLPHLSCPIVRERNNAYQVLQALNMELERRIGLEVKNRALYESLPSLVLIMDEFPSLFSVNQDKKVVRQFTEAISNLLRRGRHGKIHVVLAAQNPTIHNMKIDLGNVTTRIAFKCAKQNFSEIILGDVGAENLAGKGDLLFKSFQYDTPQRMQGIFISDEETSKLIKICNRRWNHLRNSKLKFVFDTKQWSSKILNTPASELYPGGENQEELLLSKIILWVISQRKVSCNLIQKKFGLGWNRADEIMNKLYGMGLIERLDAKLPRKVCVEAMEDMSGEALKILLQSGILQDNIQKIILSKK